MLARLRATTRLGSTTNRAARKWDSRNGAKSASQAVADLVRADCPLLRDPVTCASGAREQRGTLIRSCTRLRQVFPALRSLGDANNLQRF
jgi:hypothetical protein